nr:tRNA 2-selenouridine(34) synthase MnmH [Tissierella sp.]
MFEINYSDISRNNTNNVFIDVRSPKEFSEETIPGAVNIPIFDNKERELIGTLYKNKSIEEAKRTGIDIASKKLPAIYEEVAKYNVDHNHIYMFCSRGGFRSSALAPFFHALNMSVLKLHGGYKNYRAFIRENLPEISKDLQLVVLYGNTGTGKTHILNNLRDSGMNVLDLEGCANHRGSILGSVGLGEANSQKMFESLVYEQLENRTSNLVFVEGESKRIGKSLIPEFIFDKMINGIKLKITAPMEKRVEIIQEDYVNGADSELTEALNHMRNRLGNEKIDRYVSLVEAKDYSPIIKDLFINYYDPLYEKHKKEFVKTFENLDSSDTATNIIQWIKEEK